MKGRACPNCGVLCIGEPCLGTKKHYPKEGYNNARQYSCECGHEWTMQCGRISGVITEGNEEVTGRRP